MLHSFCLQKANNRVNVRERPRARGGLRLQARRSLRPGGVLAQPGVLGRGCPQAGGLPAALLLPPVMALGQSPPHAVSVGRSSADPQHPQGRAPPRRRGGVWLAGWVPARFRLCAVLIVLR